MSFARCAGRATDASRGSLVVEEEGLTGARVCAERATHKPCKAVEGEVQADGLGGHVDLGWELHRSRVLSAALDHDPERIDDPRGRARPLPLAYSIEYLAAATMESERAREEEDEGVGPEPIPLKTSRWGALAFPLLIQLLTTLFVLATAPVEYVWSLNVFLAILLSPFHLFLACKLWPKKGEHTICLLSEEVRVGVGSQRHIDLPYAEIASLELRAGGPGRPAGLGIASSSSRVPMEIIPIGVEAARLRTAILRKIVASPDGPAQILQMQDDVQQRARLDVTKPVITWVWCLVLVLVFLAEWWLHALDDAYTLLSLGANARPLVLHGEYYRLVSATFLHGSWMHLWLNVSALLSLGGMIERLLGRPYLVSISMGSGIMGAAASAIARDGIAVGASAALFGLLGALAWIHLVGYREIPRGFRISKKAWLLNAAVIAVIAFLPQIDNAAHLGGFFGGVVLTAALTSTRPTFPMTGRATIATRGLAMVLAAVTAAGLASAVLNALKPERERRLDVLRAYGEYGQNSSILNAMAWRVAMDAQATGEELAEAVVFATRAVDLEERLPNKTALRGTLATLHYRQGRFLDAVTEGLDLMSKGETAAAASQLARFLYALVRSTRKPVVALSPDPELRLQMDEGMLTQADQVIVAEGPIPSDLTAYLVAVRDQKIVGLLRVGGRSRPDGSGPIPVVNPWKGSELVLAWVGPGFSQPKAWVMDPRIAALP